MVKRRGFEAAGVRFGWRGSFALAVAKVSDCGQASRIAVCAVGLGGAILASSCVHETGLADDMAVEGRSGASVGQKSGSALQTELDGLENVRRVSEGVYSGSVPATRAAFESLERLGVLTVVSVDGAEPELDFAHALAMQYVHVPIGYDGIDVVAMGQLAAVMRDLPRPIYVHCHHGKHRGPAGAAAGLVAIGEIEATDGVAFMRIAGTSDAYPGLYRDVSSASVLDEAAITAARLELVERRTVTGMIAAMVGINEALDRLKLCREVAWGVPEDHPDVAPAAEAGIIRDLLANLADAPGAEDEPEAFRLMLAASVAAADRLEEGLAASAILGSGDKARENAAHERNYLKLTQTCTDCHLQYRNQ